MPRLAFVGVDGSIPNKDLNVKPGYFDAPAWSPAGDGVALATQNEAGEGELILAGQDGKVKQVLASLSGPVTFAWSPKGIYLAYAVYDPAGLAPTIHLVVLDSSSPGPSQSSHPGGCGGVFLVSGWTEDRLFYPGKWGAFRLSDPDGGPKPRRARTWLCGFMIGSAEPPKRSPPSRPRIRSNKSFPFTPNISVQTRIWSPDSQELVLSGVDAGGANAIYTVGADGSHFQKIADGDLAFWAWK